MRGQAYVMPAKAGIQGWGGILMLGPPTIWMPAFAGMTMIHQQRQLQTNCPRPIFDARPPPHVIPAKAGIQGWGGMLTLGPPTTWMPAFAGMTMIHQRRQLRTNCPRPDLRRQTTTT